MYKSICLILFTALSIITANAQTPNKTTMLSATEFLKKMEQTVDAQIVDVRTPKEFENGHIKDALSLDWNDDQFENHLATLDKSKPVFVYCLSGGRSGEAVSKMSIEGFAKIYEMPGGMLEWRAENLPEISKKIGKKGMRLQQFEALLNSDKPVLVDFYADWCAPCKKMKPYLEKIAEELADKVQLVRIDVDEHAELCTILKVSNVPELKLYNHKQLQWEHSGFIEEKELRKQLP